MRRWLHLATRNWWVRKGRAIASVVSVALGVGTVVSVTAFYETARRTIADEVVGNWVGTAHISVQPPGAHDGSLDLNLVAPIAAIDNVKHVTARLRRRMYFVPPPVEGQILSAESLLVDALGVNPDTELNFRTLPALTGRFFDASERNVAVMEREVASDYKLSIGDTIYISPFGGSNTTAFTITGLFQSQRLAEFQKPAIYLPIADVQDMAMQPGKASVIEIMLTNSEPEALAVAREQVEALIEDRNLPHKVESAEARLSLLLEADRLTRMVLMVIAFVSMLTGFFIILTTMSMSLFERRGQLGTMRCLGVTRSQLALLLVLELFPLGILGTLLGVGGGVVVSRYIASLPSLFIPRLYFSPWGIQVAVVSGLVTTLLSIFVLIFQICRVTPLVAMIPQARPAKFRYVVLSAVLGVSLIGLHESLRRGPDLTHWLKSGYSFLGVGSLHLGYILLAPIVVWLVGRPIARVIGPLLGLRGKLAAHPFGHTPWRSTGVCWMLMVGISLTVYASIRTEGIYAIWGFPAQLPEAFVWTPEYVDSDTIERVRKVPGVGALTVTTDVDCKLFSENDQPPEGGLSFLQNFLRSLARPVFVVGEPEELLSILKLGFVEGDLDEAIAKLDQGGHVVIPIQTSRRHDLHLGDDITIEINNRRVDFEIAGVVQSPALDIAVTFFQAQSYFQLAAANALLGTRRDLKEKFGLDVISMFLCNLDMPPTNIPEDFGDEELSDFTQRTVVARAMLRWGDSLPNQRATIDAIKPEIESFLEDGIPLSEAAEAQLARFATAMRYVSWRWFERTVDQSWAVFRERLVLMRIADEMERPNAIIGSVSRLKEAAEGRLRRATAILTWMPTFSLMVAAIGIANLMMVSVHARSRQIAILRAIGAVRSQIIRMVLAEAITLGILGSVMGLALGFHEAHTAISVTNTLGGIDSPFLIPAGKIAVAVLITVTICLLAGIGPARYAARNDIVSAMETM